MADMVDDIFALDEFRALRKEIDDSKARLFLLVGAGFPILSTADLFAWSEVGQRCLYTALLPLLVVIFGLLFLMQNNCIYRAGKYIRENLELKYGPGWETWLNLKDESYDHRCFDRRGKVILLALYIVYYVAASSIATTCLFNVLDIWSDYFEVKRVCLVLMAIISYFLLGLYSINFLWRTTYMSTDFSTTGRRFRRISIVLE